MRSGRRRRPRAGFVRLACVMAVAAVALASCAEVRPVRSADIDVPEGFKIEAVAERLAAPTMVAFDDQGRMLIAESGYRGGGDSKVSRLEPDGTKTVLADGPDFGDEVPVTAVAFHQGRVYVSHAGTVSVIEPDGRFQNLITGLPGQGDHQVNQIVFSDDGFMYFAVGTVTTSSVVGPDNKVFGWLEDPERRNLHDVPCFDIRLTGEVFESENALGDQPARVRTSPYSPYGTVRSEPTVQGDPKCNGAILRARPDGSGLEVYAWGLRNPYGLDLAPDGSIYATMHGFDARGSRPIEDAWDCFYKIDQGAWYGWPDFACDVPVTDERFKVKDKPQAAFVIADHPTESPPRPIAKFDPHAGTNGFAFAPSERWGGPNTVYVALFGDFTPGTGTTARPEGVKVVRVDLASGEISDFVDNITGGQAHRHSSGGLEHPSDVAFGPDGAMYITDWGIARVSDKGLVLEEDTGVIWKLSPGRADRPFPGGISLLYVIAGTLVLAVLTLLAGAGRARTRKPVYGLAAGAAAGLVMGLFTMAVAAPVLDLPWHSPPRVLATMVMGRSALASILEFAFLPWLVGTLVLVVLTTVLGGVFAAAIRAQSRLRIALAGVLFALTGWAILQYFLFPLLFPLVTEKGFPPGWYALSFGVYGLALGALMALSPPAEPAAAPGPGGPPPRAAAPPGAPSQQPESDLEEWSQRLRRLRESSGG